MIKAMTYTIAAVLFLPGVLVGFLFACGRAGFEAGIDIAKEVANGD